MWAACSSGLGGLEAWGLMAPVEFLSMGHYNSLVFAHLVEVDGFLAFRGHGPVPSGVSIRSALQAANPRQFCSMEVLGCATLSSDTGVGR